MNALIYSLPRSIHIMIDHLLNWKLVRITNPDNNEVLGYVWTKHYPLPLAEWRKWRANKYG